MVEPKRPLFGAFEPATDALTAGNGNGQVAVSRFFTEGQLSLAVFGRGLRPEAVEGKVTRHTSSAPTSALRIAIAIRTLTAPANTIIVVGIFHSLIPPRIGEPRRFLLWVREAVRLNRRLLEPLFIL